MDSSGEHSESLSSPTDSMDSKKTRRKSSSSPAAVKSPALAIKRSDSAPVTLQGWLYKQGSDGLQLWKKRWFVLSEFCLFYYKGEFKKKIFSFFFEIGKRTLIQKHDFSKVSIKLSIKLSITTKRIVDAI